MANDFSGSSRNVVQAHTINDVTFCGGQGAFWGDYVEAGRCLTADRSHLRMAGARILANLAEQHPERAEDVRAMAVEYLLESTKGGTDMVQDLIALPGFEPAMVTYDCDDVLVRFLLRTVVYSIAGEELPE